MRAKRTQLLRWLGWFAMANAIILGLIGLRYLGSDTAAQTPLAWVYLISIYISHYSWLTLLPLLLLVTPVIVLRPRVKAVKITAVLLVAALVAILMLDSLLWSQSRFHINLLTLKILGVQSWVFSAVMFLIALWFESMLATRVWLWVNAKPARRGRKLAALIAVLFVISQGIYAWSDANYYVPVTSVAQQLPVHRGFTAKKLLVRFGLVDISQSRERQLARRVAGDLKRAGAASLVYPLTPLECSFQNSGEHKLLNLIIILVDALRADMLGKGLTPVLDNFARERATRFSNHFSGGNSSRMGVFSLFYGLPPGYFRDFEALQKPPVLMDRLMLNGYQLGLFSSSNLYRPVTLDRTAFSRVKNLRLETRPVTAPAWERDRIMTSQWQAWLDQRDRAKPFFGFLFYDAVNDKTYPPEFKDRTVLNAFDPMPGPLADYKRAVTFTDTQIGHVLADLEKRGLIEQTIVLISADHGEEFNEHGDGISGHGSGYSHYQLKVPLLLAWPGIDAQHLTHRTSHYDIAPTLLKRMFACSNPSTDYSSGHDLYTGPQWDWLLAGSYYNYAVLEPGQVTVTFPNGLYEIRDNDYRLLEQPQFNAAVLEAVMRENMRFHQ